jgi:mono/diheme cytochrome c family protein
VSKPPGIASALVVLAAVSFLALPVHGDGEEVDVVPASSGVYTVEQAEAGREAYAAHCARCHGAELGGGFGPALAPLDWAQFGDRPLAHVFRIMTTEMPFDAPGSLDDDVYAAILAFVLEENGYDGGPEPLPSELEALAHIVLDALPAD